MELTIKDILKMDFMSKAELISGDKGINRQVKYVDVMEVPDVDEWIKEGVFLLTTGYNIKDNPSLQKRIIKRMFEVNAGALCIKEGRYLKNIPALLIELGDRFNLPIIKIPKDIPYNKIMIPLFSQILDKKNISLSRFEKIHNELTKVVLKGGGIDLLAQTLHKLINKPVLIQDNNLKTLALVGKYEEEKEIRAHLETSKKKLLDIFSSSRKAARIKYKNVSFSKIVAPIFITDEIYGFVSAFEMNDNKLDNIDFRAVELTSTNIALELLKKKDRVATENRLKSEFIDDLLNDNYNDEMTMLQRGKYFNWDLRSDYYVIVVDIDNFEEFYLNLDTKNEDIIQQIKDKIKSIIKWELMMFDKDIIIINQSDSFVIFYKSTSSQKEKELNKFCEKIKEEINKQISDITVSIGIGNLYQGMEGLKKSYNEAFKSLEMGKKLFSSNKIIKFNKLGIFRVISKLDKDPDLFDFYEEKLGPLINSDKQELVNTISSIIKNFGNKTAAAKDLCIHRNTLNYRIKKIENILDIDLDKAENYLDLYLALKIRRLKE
ncbi:MAG: PucR family transcriptional regulator [Bacillota bacterium]